MTTDDKLDLKDVSPFWEPWEVVIEDFDGLLEILKKLMVRSSTVKECQYAWRGQVDARWALHSSLYRHLLLTGNKIPGEKAVAGAEDEILKRLHQWGLHSSPGTGQLTVLNQLALLQHYGAPTRLIDVTLNPWVGVWFAVEQQWQNVEANNADARLFAFDISDRLINMRNDYLGWEGQHTVPWERKNDPEWEKEWTTEVFAWKPANLDSRIFAQNGAFLFGGVVGTQRRKKEGKGRQPFQIPTGIVGRSWWPINEVHKATCLALRSHKFNPANGAEPNGNVYTFRIKAAAKADIRRRLEEVFGYKHSTLYPDFTGFAKYGIHNLGTKSS